MTKEEKTTTTLRVPNSLYEKVIKESQKKDRSINYIIIEALRSFFEKKD